MSSHVSIKIHIVETSRIQQEISLASHRVRKRKRHPRACLARYELETDLLGTGSSGAACADVGDFDVVLRQTRLPLQLAHGRVGCSAAGAHGPHYRLAFGTTLALGNPLPIDCTLLVEAAFRHFAGIVSCEIERPYDN